MFLSAPEILPDRLRDTLGTIDEPLCTEPGAQRGLFDADCPLALPRDIGMSILLTSPAFLLADPGAAPLRPEPAGHRRGARRPAGRPGRTSCTSARAGSSSATGSATTRCRSRSSSWPSVSIGSSTGRPALGDAARHGPRRRLDRRQRVGRGVGPAARVVSAGTAGSRRVAAAAGSLVGRRRLRRCPRRDAARPRLLGHGRAAGGRAAAWARPTRPAYPTYVLLGWLANLAAHARSASRRSG